MQVNTGALTGIVFGSPNSSRACKILDRSLSPRCEAGLTPETRNLNTALVADEGSVHGVKEKNMEVQMTAGYMGRIGFVNLTTGDIRPKVLDSELARSYIGG